MALEIGLFLVFLDVESIGFRPDFPVDVPDVITRGVFPMRRKFNRKSVVGTLVLPGQKTFHHQSRAHIHPLDTVECFGVKMAWRGWAGHGLALGRNRVQSVRLGTEGLPTLIQGSDAAQLESAWAICGATSSPSFRSETFWINWSITLSLVIPMDSALKFVMTRCRNTG